MDFDIFLAEMLPIKWAIKRSFTMPPQITFACALPGKTQKHENHIFHSIGLCYIHVMHLCTIFLKEKIVICNVLDSV